MASGLSLLIEVKGAADLSLVAGILGGGGGAGATNPLPLPTTGPQILHYVWAVDMTSYAPPKTGQSTILLTTVYDEDFASYIKDLVVANPTPFNAATKVIVGLEGMAPVEQHLDAFVQFVREHDLTDGGTTPFSEAYSWSVVAIVNAMGSAPGEATTDQQTEA